MLTGLLGIRLILLIGKTIPKPVPYEVSTSLITVEVTNSSDQGDGFQMTFTLDMEKTQDYSLLRSGIFDPSTRVIIGVLLGASPEVLIDGIIMHHEIKPSYEPGMSTLVVKGRDVSVMLDLEERNGKFENQPDSVIVTQLLAKYAKYGLAPQVTTTTDTPVVTDRIPRQHETDLQYIQRLAKRNGFVFYIEPLSIGSNTAYWGKENRLGTPQPALTMNMGAANNATLSGFTQDALASVEAKGSFLEPFTKTLIPIPSLPSLRIPPLASSSAPTLRTILLRANANQDAGQAALSSLAARMNAPQGVSSNGSVDTVRYGHVLRARKLVGVRGVGASYNGNYYVKSVTHQLEQGNYTQNFELIREGTGASLPVVVP